MAASGFRDYVEAIRSAVDIADVVGESVALRKAGHALVGLCPFHQEKTPSFRVDPDKGLYYCFGCQAGGDVFSFVKSLHGLDFAEAAQMLGDRCGIPRPAPRGARDRGRGERDDSRARVLAALETVQGFFKESLLGPAGGAARRHLADRGLGSEHAEEFGLGFAPEGWDHQLRHLVARGYKPEELVEAGLALAKRQGSGFYDRFRSRITFPIRDAAGRIVSFGGRIVGEGEPKYLNGPESRVYEKSRTLYRLSEVGSEIRQAGRSVIVEGYFDAVGLAARGVPGVVAVCGTALSPDHARMLSRFSPRVVLAFDADEAGRRAARRALAPLLHEGLEVRVAVPEEGLDPEELGRRRGAEAVQQLVDSASTVAEFLVDESRREFDVASIEGRVAALEMTLQHLLSLPSAVARAESIAVVSDGLGIEDDLVRDELRRAARERRTRLRSGAFSAPVPEGAARSVSPVEADILRYLCGPGRSSPSEAMEIIESIPRDAIGDLARELISAWAGSHENGAPLDHRQLAEVAPERDRAAVWGAAMADGPAPDAVAARECVAKLHEKQLRDRLGQVQRQIESADDSEDMAELTREKIAVARRLDELRHGVNISTSG